jgi:hypothetical protein
MEQERLSKEVLESLGFKPVDLKDRQYPFTDMSEMPYYAKDAVLLFYPFAQDAFLLGYGDMRCGIYHMATIRWLHTLSEVTEAYKALTGKELDPPRLKF